MPASQKYQTSKPKMTKKTKKAKCKRHMTEEDDMEILADLISCIENDQFGKAMRMMKRLQKEDRKRIVARKFRGKPPLFVAAQHGMTHFVSYFLIDCEADIEQRGVYEFPGNHSQHQATPLWCAAVTKKIKVVKMLLQHSANVHASSDTELTPVRAACCRTNIEVVKYLIEKGANVHKPSKNGRTCLMSSGQSVDLCRFLIDMNANVNAQDCEGNTALHYAIRNRCMETVHLLLKHGSDPYGKNVFGDDAIQTAAVHGCSDILEFLIDRMKPTIERQIECYELSGTYFVDKKQDIQQAIQNWHRAMALRYKDPECVIEKRQSPPNPAYQNHVEASSMADLAGIETSPDAVYMESLLIRERILGREHETTLNGLLCRGTAYRRAHRYGHCIDLWKYVLRFTQSHRYQAHCAWSTRTLSMPSTALASAHGLGLQPLSHGYHILLSLCKLFCDIYAQGFTENVHFDDVYEVFEMCVEELQCAQQHFNDIADNTSPSSLSSSSSTISAQQQQQEQHQQDFENIISMALHLINLLCALPQPCATKTFQFEKTVYRLNKLGLRNKQGRTLLHLAVDKTTTNILERRPWPSIFPSANILKVLLECGADVEATDADNNTALHLIVSTAVASQESELSEQARQEMETMIDALLKAGSHADAVNREGVTATHDLSNWWPEFRINNHVSLKCLCARAVRKYGLKYVGEVPTALYAFIEKH